MESGTILSFPTLIKILSYLLTVPYCSVDQYRKYLAVRGADSVYAKGSVRRVCKRLISK